MRDYKLISYFCVANDNFDMVRSDVLVSSIVSSKEKVGQHYHDPYTGPDFHQSNMATLVKKIY